MVFMDSLIAPPPPPIPKYDFALYWLGLGNVLDLFRFRLPYLQLLSSSGMVVFL